MPDPIIHYSPTAQSGGRAACGTVAPTDGELAGITARFGMVTCFACRRSIEFKREQQGVGTPTPIKLSGVMADDEQISKLAEAAFKESKNERGMYVVEEFIHHGEYRSKRRVEVYDVTASTMDGVLMSSAYGYGSWQNPENPAHTKHRRDALLQLVDDLRHLRTNRAIGWSTFRLLTKEEQ